VHLDPHRIRQLLCRDTLPLMNSQSVVKKIRKTGVMRPVGFEPTSPLHQPQRENGKQLLDKRSFVAWLGARCVLVFKQQEVMFRYAYAESGEDKLAAGISRLGTLSWTQLPVPYILQPHGVKKTKKN
jgi:hypothetical protein